MVSWHLNICANQGAFCLGRLVSTKNKDLGHVHTFLHMKYNFLQNLCYTLELLQGFGVFDVYSIVQASDSFQKILSFQIGEVLQFLQLHLRVY